MSSLAIEIHGERSYKQQSQLLSDWLSMATVNTRGDLLPDPAHDQIQAIFYCFQNEDDNISDNGRKEGTHIGVIAIEYSGPEQDIRLDLKKLGLSRYSLQIVEDELDLLKALVDQVREWDPEIFTGYDVLKDSWGYLVERADVIGTDNNCSRNLLMCYLAPELEIVTELSRVRTQSTGKKGSKNEDRWGYSKGATLRITGRHVLPVWRLLKSDANLTIYSLENVAFHVLRQRRVIYNLWPILKDS